MLRYICVIIQTMEISRTPPWSDILGGWWIMVSWRSGARSQSYPLPRDGNGTSPEIWTN